MDNDVLLDPELIHDRDAEFDPFAAIYKSDVVRFIYNNKVMNGIVDTVFEEGGEVVAIAILHLDSDQEGAVIKYNVRGGETNDAIESIFVLKKLMPTQARTMEDLEEKMYITFDGVWGSENISGWVKKIDKSNPRSPVITIDPVVIDELQEEKESNEMDIDAEDFALPVRRLLGGGIQVMYNRMGYIYETLLPYPQNEEQFRNWVKIGNVEEIKWSGPAPGFKAGKQIPPYKVGLSKDEQCLYDFQFIKQHWPDGDMEEFFEGATNMKGKRRSDGLEKKKVDGEEVDGIWTKYKEGWTYVTVPLMWIFWAAK